MSLCKEKLMLTVYFSCYKLNNKSIPFQEEKKITKLKDCLIFSVIKVLGYSSYAVHKLQKEKENILKIFYTCILVKVITYQTGSAFTQHYLVHWMHEDTCCIIAQV